MSYTKVVTTFSRQFSTFVVMMSWPHESVVAVNRYEDNQFAEVRLFSIQVGHSKGLAISPSGGLLTDSKEGRLRNQSGTARDTWLQKDYRGRRCLPKIEA